MSLQTIYEELQLFNRYEASNSLLTEQLFKSVVLPSVHSYINNYDPESNRRIKILQRHIALPISGNGPAGDGIFTFDMSDYNTTKNYVEAGVVDDTATSYVRNANISVPDLIIENVGSPGQYGWDGNNLTIWKSLESEAITAYLRGYLRLPVTGMSNMDLTTLADFPVVEQLVNAAPEIYVLGCRWAWDDYNMVELNKLQHRENLFTMAIDENRRTENIITEYHVSFGEVVAST